MNKSPEELIKNAPEQIDYLVYLDEKWNITTKDNAKFVKIVNGGKVTFGTKTDINDRP